MRTLTMIASCVSVSDHLGALCTMPRDHHPLWLHLPRRSAARQAFDETNDSATHDFTPVLGPRRKLRAPDVCKMSLFAGSNRAAMLPLAYICLMEPVARVSPSQSIHPVWLLMSASRLTRRGPTIALSLPKTSYRAHRFIFPYSLPEGCLFFVNSDTVRTIQLIEIPYVEGGHAFMCSPISPVVSKWMHRSVIN
ncbi:hypothetical protein EDD17DRAFT_1008325 [Pisolithus thermaeus]|nr:hypothetical protein EV401DRAFT_470517 [Pisolithus croceorrhizus]KAI6158439.1 hypothetical protein EDD17DRAFT_1008325 [Pisolithus thermaeus]